MTFEQLQAVAKDFYFEASECDGRIALSDTNSGDVYFVGTIEECQDYLAGIEYDSQGDYFDDEYEFDDYDDEHDPFLSDAEADADALASAGWGTDEDYGGYDDYDYGLDDY